MRDSYQYLSKSSYTPSTSLYPKTSPQYNTYQSTKYDQPISSITQPSSYHDRWAPNSSKTKSQHSNQLKPQQFSSSFPYSNDNYLNIKRLPDEYSSLRQTFDTRSNNRVKDLITKYQTDINNIQMNDDKNRSKYDRNQYKFYSPKKYNNNKYNKYNQNIQKYQYKNDIFQQDVQMTKKMSEQIQKLKQDRRKRLQANKKQCQQYNPSSTYNPSNLNNSYNSYNINTFLTNSNIYDNNESKNTYKITKQQQNFKKKKLPQQPNTVTSNTTKYEKKIYDEIKKGKQKSKDKTNNLYQIKQLNKKYPSYQSKYNYDRYYQSNTQNIKNHSVISAYNSKGLSSLKYKDKQYYKIIQINNFILGKSLGEGKFGIVYQALHKPTGWLFAIKKIPKNMIKSNLMIDQFILELKLQTYLYHQNILSLYTHFDDKDSFYLVLQYMEDGTLFAHLKKNKTLPEVEVATKIKQIASAVKYLHENQIAHRDIKPQNIVMSHGVCKLCDFGWATICSERRKTYCGTFDYAPPQILQGIQYDYTADLWCLGVLTYELLVGKAPFYHISRKQTMKKILNVQKTNIEYPLNISKTAINFMDSLIKKDPKQRLSGEMLLQHPFLKYSDKNTSSKY